MYLINSHVSTVYRVVCQFLILSSGQVFVNRDSHHGRVDWPRVIEKKHRPIGVEQAVLIKKCLVILPDKLLTHYL